MKIEPYAPRYSAAVVDVALRAWTPVFASIQEAMEPEVFAHFYPDWRADQARAVAAACADPGMRTWLAMEADQVLGFVVLRHDEESSTGEIYMIAVDPGHQRRGVATALSEFAFAQMKAAGLAVAMVETGGDPGHAPARAAYEKLGFRLLPIARYFKKL